MGGRPWGPVKSDDPVTRDAVLWLRGLIERSGKTVRDVAAACGCKPATVSTRLNGSKPPSLEFGDQVIEACTPRAVWPAKKTEFRKLRNRPRVAAPVPVVQDARTRVLDAQAETARAQAHAVRALDELNHAKDQLLAGIRVEFQAAQIIAALRQVLLRLIGAGASVAGERSQVRSFLQRAKEDRSRAERLAEEAQAVLDALGAHIAAADLPAGDPVLSSDSLLLDIPAGLVKVQRLLAEQDAQLSSWEYAESHAEAAARLSLLYVDAPMPVAILDDDRFLWANTPFEQLVRYSAGELSRMRWTDVVRGWDPDEDHLVCPREGDLCNVQVQRWTVSGCEIAVVHNPLYWEKYGIPSEKWAKQYLRLSGIARNGKICAARFSVNEGSFSGRVRFEAEIAYQYSRAIFRLVADGQLVVQLGGFGRYLVIFSGQRADLGELPDLARSVPEEFRIDATVDRGEASGLSMDELLWDLETSSRWAKAAESSKLWTVPDPVFRGAEPAAAGELSFRPMIDGDGDLFCVEVVNAISADSLARALRLLRSWAEKFWGPHVPEVEFSVTPEELRRRDWRTLVKFGKYLDKKIKLVLDELRDFETYALLRRFEFVGSVAVRRVALGDDAREILGVPAPLTGLKAGPLTDADGVEKLIAALRR